jgi:dTDP-4-dehydrorhamnose reductase
MNSMRILIIGAGGMLGTDLVKHWTDDEVIAATSRDADILEIEQVRSLVLKTHPDWIILTAAYTDVDASERRPDQAFAVNGTGTENVARVASETGSRLFYVSTDYLFDGASQRPYEPNDTVAPLNVYGASKAAGEKAVMNSPKDWCIARTSWLFGAAGASFPEKILHAAETRPELTVVADQVGSPTFTRDLARAIRALVRADARGIIHVTNSGSCSWYDFAREVLRQAGRDAVLVRPITTAEAGRLAKRPAYSVLSPASLNAHGITMRSWHEALPDYLKELRDHGKLN